MTRFFIEGNLVLMSILTLLFALILGLSVFAGISAFRLKSKHTHKAQSLVGHIQSLALFTLTFGVFGQILGLVDVFDYLANQDANVASSILARGIKITFHPTLFGLIIYLTAILISLGLKFVIQRQADQDPAAVK